MGLKLGLNAKVGLRVEVGYRDGGPRSMMVMS